MLLISKKDKSLFEAGQVVIAIDEDDFNSKYQVVKGDDGLPHLYISSPHRKYTAVIAACLALTVLNLTVEETRTLMESKEHRTTIYRASPSTGLTRKEQIEKGVAEKIEVTAAFNGDYEKASDVDKINPQMYSFSYKYLDENKVGDKVEVR